MSTAFFWTHLSLYLPFSQAPQPDQVHIGLEQLKHRLNLNGPFVIVRQD
jgi:hypothetical protein